MVNGNAVTILWWTVPFRWIFWFATIFASVIGFFEVVENYLSLQLPISEFQQIPAALFSSGVGVLFLTNEKILNAHKNIKNIDSLSERLAKLEASMTPQQLREFEKIENTTEKLAQFGVELDPWHEIKLGDMAHLAGRNEDAQRYFKQAYDDFLRLNDDKGQAQALNDLGNVESTFSNLNQSAELHNQSLQIRTKIGDRKGISASLNNLGNIAKTRGDLAEAERLHRESLAIEREIGNRQGEASSLGNLGNIAVTRGDLAEAERVYRESLAIMREIGDRGREATTLNSLGNIAEKRGDLAEAERLQRESHMIEREIGIPMIGGEFFENFG
jgi:tetratricopeptide (TPR) repeat protein